MLLDIKEILRLIQEILSMLQGGMVIPIELTVNGQTVVLPPADTTTQL